MGLWAPSAEGCAVAAANEINEAGGVLGAEVELFEENAGATPQQAHDATQKLIFEHNVDAIVGMQASYMRSAVRDAACGLAPYIYTPQYEGGFTGPGTATVGITDTEVLNPGIDWMVQKKRARRFFFLGNDYIWPRVAFGTSMKSVRDAGATCVGQAILPLGSRDYGQVLDQIRASQPDVVICVLLGEDSVCFNRAFAEQGLSRHILRLTLAFEETLLYAVGPENVENLFAVQTFFSNNAPQHRDRMLDSYRKVFPGGVPTINANAMNVYDSVHLVAELARKARRVDGLLMARLLDRNFNRPTVYDILGKPEVAPVPKIHIAEADGTRFEIRESV